MGHNFAHVTFHQRHQLSGEPNSFLDEAVKSSLEAYCPRRVAYCGVAFHYVKWDNGQEAGRRQDSLALLRGGRCPWEIDPA